MHIRRSYRDSLRFDNLFRINIKEIYSGLFTGSDAIIIQPDVVLTFDLLIRPSFMQAEVAQYLTILTNNEDILPCKSLKLAVFDVHLITYY